MGFKDLSKKQKLILMNGIVWALLVPCVVIYYEYNLAAASVPKHIQQEISDVNIGKQLTTLGNLTKPVQPNP